MTKPLKAAMLAMLLTALVPVAVAAHSYGLGALKIGHPWARPTPAAAQTAAGFLSITNSGHTPDRLVSVTSSAADHVELHEMSMTGGIMRMRPLPNGLEIAPGQTVTLAPGGYHLMFIGPRRPFRVGDHIPGVLRFERAGAVSVEFYVETAPAEGAAGMAGMPGMQH